MCRRAGRPIRRAAQKLDGRVYETAAPAAWFLGVDSKGVAATGDALRVARADPREARCEARLRRLSSVAFAAIPRAAVIRATFDGSDPKTGPVVGAEIDAPTGATRLRVVAEVNGQFSQEESAPLQAGHGRWRRRQRPKAALKPDAPATMTSRFEPKDTAAAFSALDRLAKTAGRACPRRID